MVRSIAGWVLGALLIAAALAYLGDSLYIRHKVASATSAGLGNVRFYYATRLKNGKLNIYQDSPQNEVCVHALFPHYGYKPCWFASRTRCESWQERRGSRLSIFSLKRSFPFQLLYERSIYEVRWIGARNLGQSFSSARHSY